MAGAVPGALGCAPSAIKPRSELRPASFCPHSSGSCSEDCCLKSRAEVFRLGLEQGLKQNGSNLSGRAGVLAPATRPAAGEMLSDPPIATR